MKRCLSILLTLAMVFGLSASALAGGPWQSERTPDEITYSHEEADIALETGESITLTVTTKKQGVHVETAEGWETELVDGYYISTFTFEATEAGNFEVDFWIKMSANNDPNFNNAWIAGFTWDVTVTDPADPINEEPAGPCGNIDAAGNVLGNGVGYLRCGGQNAGGVNGPRTDAPGQAKKEEAAPSAAPAKGKK